MDVNDFLYEMEQDIKNFYNIDTINRYYNLLLRYKDEVDVLMNKAKERLDLIENGEKVYVIMKSPHHWEIHVFYSLKEMVDKEWFQGGELVETGTFKGKNADKRKEKFVTTIKEKYNIYATIDHNGKILEKY